MNSGVISLNSPWLPLPIGEIVDSCRVWESHSDSNRIPTGNYDSEVGSQSSDSRTWE